MYVPSTIDFLSDSGNADSEDKRGERDPAVISPMVGLSDGSQTTIFAVSDAQTLNIQLRGCACWQSINSSCWTPTFFLFFFSHRSRYSNSEAATLEANLSSVQCVIVRIVVVVVAIQTSTPYLCGPRQTDRLTDADGRGRTDGRTDRSLAGWSRYSWQKPSKAYAFGGNAWRNFEGTATGLEEFWPRTARRTVRNLWMRFLWCSTSKLIASRWHPDDVSLGACFPVLADNSCRKMQHVFWLLRSCIFH